MGWAGFGLLTVDVAYYQGDYWADASTYGVIVNVARGNQGAYSETTWGRKQVANARASGKAVGFYFFNGNLDAYTCGVLFGRTLASLGFNPATDVVGIDCEDEGSSGTAAWGPAQCAAFINGVSTVVSVSWSQVLIYMNYTVNRRFDWSGPVAWGAHLWYARPGGPLDQHYWPTVTMKQDGLYNGVDADGHDQTFSQIIGVPAPRKVTSMSAIITVPDWGGACFIVGPGSIKYVPTTQEVGMFCNLENQQIRTVGAADGSFQAMLQAYLLPITTDTAKALIGAALNYYVAPWLDARNAPVASVAITDADREAISTDVAAKVKFPAAVQIDTIPGRAAFV